jgi:hypothetical protein
VTDYSRNYQFQMPEGPDSMASSVGLSRINTWIDEVDSELDLISGYGADPALFLGVWQSASDVSLSSSATIVNAPFTWTNPVNFAGTGTVTVALSTGNITFGTDGVYRLTIAPTWYYATTITEGQFSFGLKLNGTAAYRPRVSHQMAMETRGGATMANKSFIIRCGTSLDVSQGSTYNIGMQQTNSSAVAVTAGDSDPTNSWFAIEYLRPLT